MKESEEWATKSKIEKTGTETAEVSWHDTFKLIPDMPT